MIFVNYIVKNKKLKKLLISNEKLSVKNATMLLEKFEELAKFRNFVANVEYQVCDDDETLFRDNVEVGKGNATNLLLLITNSLNTNFAEIPQADKDELIEKIANSYNIDHEEPVNDSIEVTNSKYEKGKKEKRSTKTKIFVFSRNQKIIGVLFFLFFILIVAGVSFIGSVSSNKINETSEIVIEKESYEQLLEEKKYEKILELYPEKILDLRSYLIHERKVVDLKTLNHKSKKIDADLEIAFLEKNWTRVIETKAKTDEQIAMKIFAYLNVQKIAEATKLNEEIDSKQLKTLISDYTILKNIVDEYEILLKDTNLTPERRGLIESNLKEAKEKIADLLGDEPSENKTK
ncbi:hypothetical protein RAK27_18635 [Carnobacterium maltaromaticum]|uniref:Type VII secretion protein EssB n=1 Tax=Carnobacterium maltaromaticum TaxID=2751 RepID=A0AAW9KA39_CARML|nr:hypothetical protein [Carnobacterium maltaromaticum]MDZ5760662.1 hypothetical protein [Carnobacterium maltaromaticum]